MLCRTPLTGGDCESCGHLPGVHSQQGGYPVAPPRRPPAATTVKGSNHDQPQQQQQMKHAWLRLTHLVLPLRSILALPCPVSLLMAALLLGSWAEGSPLDQLGVQLTSWKSTKRMRSTTSPGRALCQNWFKERFLLQWLWIGTRCFASVLVQQYKPLMQ